MQIGVVGAGIVGPAVARRLAELDPDATVTVFEKGRDRRPRRRPRLAREGYRRRDVRLGDLAAPSPGVISSMAIAEHVARAAIET